MRLLPGLPRPLAGFKGAASRRRGGKEKEGRGREKGGEGQGRSGRGRGEVDSDAQLEQVHRWLRPALQVINVKPMINIGKYQFTLCKIYCCTQTRHYVIE